MRSGTTSVPTFEAIARVFHDPTAVWTIDEVAGRFGLSIGQAVRAMSDLEAVGVVRRRDDEFVPGPNALAPA
jgi:DNA-binding IclR family transcriptional regulator